VRPGETPPVMPALAKEHTPQGAMAFAAYYYHALDWSIATNDAYLLAEISSVDCVTCRRFIDQMAANRESGTYVTGGRIDILGSGLATGHDVDADQVLRVRVRQGQEIIHESGTESSTAGPARTTSSLVYTSWIDNAWQVRGVFVLKS